MLLTRMSAHLYLSSPLTLSQKPRHAFSPILSQVLLQTAITGPLAKQPDKEDPWLAAAALATRLRVQREMQEVSRNAEKAAYGDRPAPGSPEEAAEFAAAKAAAEAKAKAERQALAAASAELEQAEELARDLENLSVEDLVETEELIKAQARACTQNCSLSCRRSHSLPPLAAPGRCKPPLAHRRRTYVSLLRRNARVFKLRDAA